MATEFELKYVLPQPALLELIAGDTALQALRVGPWQETTMQTTYFDTAERALSSQKWMLRCRLENGNPVVCLKIPGSSEDTRQEFELPAQGPDKVVITGVDRGSCLENYCYEAGRGKAEREAAGKAENVPCTRTIQRTPKVASQRSGTGDVFSAIVAAGAVRGISFTKSVETAADFIRTCLIRSEELGIPVTDGVCFEEVIGELDFI